MLYSPDVSCKRKFRLFGIAVILISTVVRPVSAMPTHLRVDARTNPLGLDTHEPAFSWRSEERSQNWKQTAYRIEVASSASLLSSGRADIWDSGKVNSDESIGINYRGVALQPRSRYYWRVRTWDAVNREQTSHETAWWETGLLQQEEWTSKWIYYTDPFEARALALARWLWLPESDPHNVPDGQLAEFRLLLHLSRKPESAILHCLSGGTFTTEVNGHLTGHKQFWGAFDRENVLPALKFGLGAAGDNEIVVQTTARQVLTGSTNPNGFAGVLVLRESGGSPRLIVSDSAWQARSAKPASWQSAKVVGPLTVFKVNTGSDRRQLVPAPSRLSTGVSLLRKTFAAPADVKSARLYITAMGAYSASVNGARVGEDVLTPGFTDFRKRVQYQTYDVTSLIQKGRNAIGIKLAGGWHGSPLLWPGVRDFTGPDMVRAELILAFENGKVQKIVTDHTWSGTRDATDSAEIYGGESYDARVALPNWDKTSFSVDADWKPAQEGIQPNDVAITGELDQPPHVSQSITPVSIKDVNIAGSGMPSKVFDMGQNMVGVVRVHVRGERGRTIRMRFAERLQADGNVYTENLRNADATDEYTLRGGGWEDWQPAFTFHGFRYVQIEGLPVNAGLDSITGKVENSLPVEPSMRLSTSNDLLNSMFHLGLWGQRGNFLSIPTDCPQRDERLGWMGDAGVFWRTGAYNFDIEAFTQKYMDDVTDAQDDRGAFANTSPNLELQRTGAPGWGDAGVLIPYAAWQQYGDRNIITKNWDAMERWMKFIETSNPNGLRTNNLGPNYADWLAPDPRTPADLVGTAYWALIAQQMSTMASAIGRRDDADRYSALYRKIRMAYRSAYIDQDGNVAGNTQTAYVLSLYAGLAEPNEHQAMASRLVADIERHDNHLTTGFLGTPFLLYVLDSEGQSDVAYQLLLTDTYPSWGYMVQKGATTWWERWNGDTGNPSMNSYNHYAFGSVMAWVYGRVAGIQTDTSSPGFHHLLINPVTNARLAHSRAEYDSIYGTVMTDWRRATDGSLELTVELPANTTATVHLPKEAQGQFFKDGSPLVSDVSEIGSGRTVFLSR